MCGSGSRRAAGVTVAIPAVAVAAIPAIDTVTIGAITVRTVTIHAVTFAARFGMGGVVVTVGLSAGGGAVGRRVMRAARPDYRGLRSRR